MQETWRWFGPSDIISLRQIRQAGATGIVSSLHDLPAGAIWPLSDIIRHKTLIEDAGMVWSVVESVPLHNDVKTRSGNYVEYIKNYQQTIINLGKAGITTVCYNFMPVVDWTRTNLSYSLPNTSQALRFEMTDFIAYDVYMLQRDNAENDYTAEQLSIARNRFDSLTDTERTLLEKNIIPHMSTIQVLEQILLQFDQYQFFDLLNFLHHE